ncbi:MAG: CHAP domain-containing protein [Candidatus Dojkabacteria bacterium]
MPQGKQEQYEDAIGSIFDFIFTESQKPPGKTKPLKVTGIDGTSEIVDALAAAVENPAMYVNNNTMNAFQDFVDIDLAKINLDQQGAQIRFRLKNIGQILKDPDKYIDSQFSTAEAIRKMGRMAATGEAMRGVVAGSWAAKKGLDFETRRAMAGVGRADEFSHDMMARADKLMESHFSSGSSSVSKSQLLKKYGPQKGEELFNFYRKAEKAYHTGSDKDKAAIFSGKGGDISGLYSFLEAENIREKARLETDPQKKQDYRSASRFIENMSATGEVRKVMEESKKKMKYHQDQIKDLKRRGAPQRLIDQHRKSIKGLRSDYNMAQRYEFASKLGKFEGNWYTAKDLFVDGNLLPNIINGNFFNDNLNQIKWLQPAEKSGLTFGPAFKDGTWKKGDNKWKLEFLVAKKKEGPGSKFLNSYAEAMTPLYYLSPVTWVKSLGTGEVFAYRAHLIKKTFEKKILGDVKGALAGFDMQAFMDGIMDGKGIDYINSLGGTVNADLMKKLEKFIGQEGRMTKMAYRFSAISRMKKKMGDWIEEKVGQKIRDAVGARLLAMGFIQKFGKEAVDAWILKGGFRALIKGVVTAALQAIGFSIAGPVGNAIVTALTWVATELVMKMAKPVLKFSVKTALLVIVGGLGVIVLIFGGFYMMVFGKFSHVAPDEIVQCEAYRDLGLTPIEDELVCCDGEAFSKVEGLPSYSSIPSQAKDYFNAYIQTLLTPELAEVYTKASEETGIPCEIIMGIHYMEGGMGANSSLHDGGALRGGDLLTDAISAMEHLKGKMGMAGASAGSLQLTYDKLVVGLSNYNGPGNANCSTSPMTGAPRPTRWRDSGRCPVSYGFDHIYPVNWISPQHTNMDLIYCMDTVEFTCNREATSADYDFIKDRYELVMRKSPPDGFVERAMELCYAGGNVCNPAVTDNNTRKYPLFQRPGVLTTAILAHQSSLICSGGGGGGGGGGGVTTPSQCQNLPEYKGDTSNNPYGSSIVNVARTITASSSLGQGHWNYFNRPLPGMPDQYAYNNGNLKWNQEKFINNRDDTSYLSQDIFSLYWCTWLTHDSYVGGGVPGASSVFNAFNSRTQLSQFIAYGNGYDFICNGPGVVKGISPGDVIFYTWLAPNESGYGTAAAHVGIVASVSGTTITTYESNTSRPSITLTVNADGSIGKQAGLYTLGFGRYR